MKHWMKWMSALLTLAMLLGCGALAEEAPEEAPEAAIEASVEAVEASTQDNLVVTEHTATFGDKTVNYTATAGTMVMDTALGQYEIFFTAYTARDVEDVAKRSITFTFNGGPGAASLWLHMGLLGPERIGVNPEGMLEDIQVGHNPNANSILDMTDLVFIDPVGTGYSRVSEGTDPNAFYSYAMDIASVGEFIRLYTTRNGRWGSPKYLAGESYGTTRAVGVANYLSNAYSLGLNGLMLISTANDFSTLMEENGLDLTYVLYLPSYAAIGQYHGLLEEPYQSMPLEELIAEARDFAATEYQTALFKGSRLDDAEKDAVAEKVAALTGLKQDFVRKNNLRVHLVGFCENLLAEKKLMVGRLDARYTGPVTEGDLGAGDSDPSFAALGDLFGTAVNQYIGGELDYHTDLTYETMSGAVNASWSFGLDNEMLLQERDIYNAMSHNRFLKVWVLCGYYDLATPFGCAEYVYDHVFLNPETRQNLSFTYYPSGHMIYMHAPSLEQFRKDAEAWYREK